MDVDEEADSQDQVVKKLVRYALACEFQRLPIKRIGITEKGRATPKWPYVLAKSGSYGQAARII
jgi:hypothetical protein